MVVLVTTSSRAKECAAAIENKTHQKTDIATSLAKAVKLLQSRDYDALVLDESFQQMELGSASLVTSHAGMAVPIYVNLALHGTERVALDVNCGIERLVAEKLASMRAAENLLRNELRGEVTGILLNCELAQRERQLLPSVAEKLRVMHDLAEQMRRKLEGGPTLESGASNRPPVTKSEAGLRAH